MCSSAAIEALAHASFPYIIALTTPQIARLIKDQVLHLALFGTQAGEVPTPAAESVAQTLPSGVGLNLAKVEKTAR